MPVKTAARGKGKNVDDRFISEAARKRYEAAIQRKDKILIAERGITSVHTLNWSDGRDCWTTFLNEPKYLAVEPIVREFYANFPESKHGRVHVRGLKVPFDANIINAFYELARVDNDEYVHFKSQEIDYDEILRVIAKPGVTWKVTKTGKRRINGTSLTPVARMWQYFICSKMMPETHYSSVNHDRAVLLYAIATGKKMDVGQIMMDSIRHSAKVGRGGFAFPNLITEICTQFGVRKAEDEPLFHPGPILDQNYYYKLIERPTNEGTSSTSKRPQPRPQPAASQSTKGMLQQILANTNRIERKQDWLARQNKILYDMQQSCCSKLGISTEDFQWKEWQDDEDEVDEDEEESKKNRRMKKRTIET